MNLSSSPALLGVVIYDDVEPIDVGATVGVVSMARRVLPRVRSIVIAQQAGPVQLAGGLIVHADHGFDDAPPCDVVIVCGGPGWPRAASDTRLLAFLRGVGEGCLASVCTGALVLAAAGVLDGRIATTRRRAVGQEPEAPLDRLALNGAIRPIVATVVDDGVVTSGGASLAIDATLYLLSRVFGHDAAAEVAAAIEYERAYAANQRAPGMVSGMRAGR